MELNFSKEEMIKFLQKHLYKVKDIEVEEESTEHHNTELIKYKITIVWHMDKSMPDITTHPLILNNEYGLENTFYKIFKQKLLGL